MLLNTFKSRTTKIFKHFIAGVVRDLNKPPNDQPNYQTDKHLGCNEGNNTVWCFNKENIDQSNKRYQVNNDGSLVIHMLNKVDSGTYACLMQGQDCSKTTEGLDITVKCMYKQDFISLTI